jgi:hypothetical protein
MRPQGQHLSFPPIWDSVWKRATFEGEKACLSRRKRNWIADVILTPGAEKADAEGAVRLPRACKRLSSPSWGAASCTHRRRGVAPVLSDPVVISGVSENDVRYVVPLSGRSWPREFKSRGYKAAISMGSTPDQNSAGR